MAGTGGGVDVAVASNMPRMWVRLGVLVWVAPSGKGRAVAGGRMVHAKGRGDAFSNVEMMAAFKTFTLEYPSA